MKQPFDYPADSFRHGVAASPGKPVENVKSQKLSDALRRNLRRRKRHAPAPSGDRAPEDHT